MSNHNAVDSPQVRIPPPLIVAGFIALGFAVRFLWPSYGVPADGSGQGSWLGLWQSQWPGLFLAGCVLIIVSVMIALSAVFTFYKHKTNILPHAPDQNLLQSGPFRYSRNPIYLSMILIQIGLSFLVNMPTILITVIGSYLALRYYVIAREEAYLERHFGPPYLDLKRRVRRWI